MTEQHSPEALPVVAHKGSHDTDESMFLTAADNLDRGYPLGGGNLTRAVVELIRREVGRASATEQRPVSTRHRVESAIGGVLFSVSNFPERVQSRLLGQNMAPLIDKLADAVLTVVQDEREVRADQREQDARIAEDSQFDGDDPRSSDEAAYNTARREAAAAIREGKQP